MLRAWLGLERKTACSFEHLKAQSSFQGLIFNTYQKYVGGLLIIIIA